MRIPVQASGTRTKTVALAGTRDGSIQPLALEAAKCAVASAAAAIACESGNVPGCIVGGVAASVHCADVVSRVGLLRFAIPWLP
jgi:hypothetical protein